MEIWWLSLGFIAQALFFMRFFVQWVASEKAGRSVVPLAFWYLSISGSLLLLFYAIHRRDPVFIQKHYNDLYPFLSVLEDLARRGSGGNQPG